jgi:large subunit ribosomal protein L10
VQVAPEEPSFEPACVRAFSWELEMNREEKTAVVDRLAEDLSGAQAIFAVDYRGISVPQAAELRSKLRESDAQFKVVKNRLAKLAAEKAGTEIDELLTGPIALTLINGDPVVVAKTITTFTREHEVLEYKGGLMDGESLDVDGFTAIARLPGLDVLHGQLVGLTASPLTGLVAGMNNLIAGLGRQLAQIAEQGLVSGEAPAEEPAAEAPEPEAPVEEPTPAEEPAPEETPVEEPPAEEPAPEPEAEAEEPAAEPEAPVSPPTAPAEGEDAPEETSEEDEQTDDDEPAAEPAEEE